MTKYREFKQLNLPEIDKEILQFWQENKIFEKSVNERPENNSFVFYEGPPSANGMPGIHHVMARTIKDIFCRFQTMQGHRVERKGGWDTHGLPIELSVEKELGITKEDIGTKITVEEYNAKCRSTVMRYKDVWDDLTRRMGYWVDLDHPYITFENNYIESVWWLLGQLHQKGYLYKGYTIQPYSPAAGTGLSSHELNQPGCYREVKDTSAVAQFKLIRNGKSEFLWNNVVKGEVYFLAWTTTPWTLPSNTALAVGEKIEYVLVQTINPYSCQPVNVVLAKELINSWFKKEGENGNFENYQPGDKIIPYKIIDSCQGQQLELLSYEQLLPYVQPEDGDAFKVLVGDFVSTEDGTGIVHIAPSFGADDMRVAKKYGMGSLTLVDKQGKFVETVTDFAGRYVKDYKDEGDNYKNVDVDISIKLKQENKAFNVQKYEHNYPHCWRTDKPVLYYPLDSWFVRASGARERMKELNDTINWKPASTGEGRFGKWLESLQDWNLSRSRYWGIPLPIWRTKDGTKEICIESVAMLQEEINKANKILGLNQSVPQDLHRPFIDSVILVSDEGEPMERELDLIDVWFDSGSMPYAQWHYPFENKEKIDAGKAYPADFISEGVDQTRGWFYTLHAIAAMVFDSVAFKNVVSTGLVLDKNGVKMSKRLGNVIDPFAAITSHGADATRWYMINNAPPWDNLKFDLDSMEETKRKFFGTLYNTYSFFALYANLDSFKFEQNIIPVSERTEIDKWIISLLNSLIKDVQSDYADYEPTQATRRIQTFVTDHLSNWYVRLCRRRFWKGEYNNDKIAAYQTLYECLEVIAQLMSPVAPFFADWLFKNLNEVTSRHNHSSVHLTFYPNADENAIDLALEQRMDYAQRISSLVLSLRKKENIKVRIPLSKAIIPVLNPHFKRQLELVEDLIKAEVNVKQIELLDDTSGIIKKKAKANFKTLGKRLGQYMKTASQIINELSQSDIAEIEKTGKFLLKTGSETFELTLEDFEITSEDIPGWQVANDKDITVALDITITEDLKREGLARELVNRIQNLRKSSDFEVTDKIVVYIEDHDLIRNVMENHREYISSEVLAKEIVLRNDFQSSEVVEITEDFNLGIQISKA
jgi:isoleucyl-tRNA synthetase